MRAALLAVILATGCEYTARIAGEIAIHPPLASPSAGVLVITHGAREELAAWSPAGARGELAILDFVPGGLAYRYSVTEIGGFQHAVYLAAFIDLDGDEELDAGEPFGTFDGNPILDAPGGWFDVEPTTADVAITMR